MTNIAKKISTGDKSSAIDIKTNDEIGLLSQNFEAMRVNLLKRESELNTAVLISEKSSADLMKKNI